MNIPTSLIVIDKKANLFSSKIAGFDIDSTIIKTKSGFVFAKDYDDWTIWHKNVLTRLQGLQQQGYSIVFFTNQSGLSSGRLDKTKLLNKFSNILKFLNVDATVMIASADDLFRKPSPIMWQTFVEKYNSNQFCKSTSFYVGDAAGRLALNGKKKDFSDSDKKFAINVGVNFFTPEQFFLDNCSTVNQLTFECDKEKTDRENPAQSKHIQVSDSDSNSNSENSTNASLIFSKDLNPSVQQEIIVCVGYPASTKSSFANAFVKQHNYYAIVSQDVVKTKLKCIKTVDDLVKAGKHVIVDNTNANKLVRENYIAIAKKYKCKIRCFWFTTDFDTSYRLNIYREKVSNGVRKHVPKIAFFKFRKSFEKPITEEGFDEVVEIAFVERFPTDADRAIYNQQI